MGSLSPVHWIIVMVVVLLLFGPAKLKTYGKGLGEGMRSFKKGLDEGPLEAEPPGGKAGPDAIPPAQPVAARGDKEKSSAPERKSSASERSDDARPETSS